jgi:hypothetical protein
MRILVNCVLSISAAAVLLSGCGGSQPPIGAPGAMSQSQTHSLAGARASSNVYVAYKGRTVVEFDASGREVAKTTTPGHPIDIVTDSHGNVYVLLGKRNHATVLELSPDLQHQIAQFPTPNVATRMTIDPDDNLYVDDSDYQTSYLYVLEYPYGSTKTSKTFSFGWVPGGPVLMGISVSGKYLYAGVNSVGGGTVTYLARCLLAGSGGCRFHGNVNPFDCGFTVTTESDDQHDIAALSFGQGFGLIRIFPRGYKNHGSIKPPAGYVFGCRLHGLEQFFWAIMRKLYCKGKACAVAVEFDATTGKIVRTVGDGHLSDPVAAYQAP